MRQGGVLLSMAAVHSTAIASRALVEAFTLNVDLNSTPPARWRVPALE